ncbi:DUF1684 domain-containing protein [Ulvibacter antarcticus]|uniref:DUF1684 domain-containing protein n=1 Tax=Ulvibacter antarcticus TaxID=442714 RepID=A0A3L9YIB2_9FLAO|nr:DUF1684 domain-containing protein [Ulvibacter antarcticus]RMA57895.1 hypothetical protein BXY75_2702 [Ulvibacter antarcticus]
MKKHIILILLLIANTIWAQQEIIDEIKAYQISESEKFADPETSILDEKDLKDFKELKYYPINLDFQVEAIFNRTPDEKPFLMPTTTDRLPEYVKYGEAQFEIDGKQFKLDLFQSTTPYEEEGYEDYLFLPFTDLTSGDGSYGGGRFLDARIPEGKTIFIDFNKAYNPYCAYSIKYSCPIPPKQNDLLIRIEAGVKDFGKH